MVEEPSGAKRRAAVSGIAGSDIRQRRPGTTK